MVDQPHRPIGKSALQLVLATSEEQEALVETIEAADYQTCLGKTGSMELQKVVSAIETAAKRQGLIDESLYREMHALYHAILEAVQGVTRGQAQLGDVMRTVGLKFVIVRGVAYENRAEGEWIAVALYGTIGAPVRGLEHETAGLGINHI
ncbi:hut operon transcriptional regulator HutP [Alkalibacillus almallahensis]|uniref:hut operon transcriptional regulator HutP n=1 Tax=Alkalibacillus almallahensis TaxID=1379154 RepID=UPI00141EF6AA|nr:hut operon transcriptional regulator HutP [Alkalibacillus almallahensis]NIK11924.1 hut operon positive regulator [Alkalibacillus almallahensis]